MTSWKNIYDIGDTVSIHPSIDPAHSGAKAGFVTAIINRNPYKTASKYRGQAYRLHISGFRALYVEDLLVHRVVLIEKVDKRFKF